jgi:hypothetical protein
MDISSDKFSPLSDAEIGLADCVAQIGGHAQSPNEEEGGRIAEARAIVRASGPIAGTPAEA